MLIYFRYPEFIQILNVNHSTSRVLRESLVIFMMDLYYSPASAPCRSVMMTAKLLGTKLNLIKVDLETEENLKPFFIKVSHFYFK